MNKIAEMFQSALKTVESGSYSIKAKTTTPSPDVPVAAYDYSKSTEENHCSTEEEFVGKFADIRRLLDYSYHRHYTPARQVLQDRLMTLFNATVVHDDETGAVCEMPDHNWIVFTAGPMGAGKSHTLVWFSSRDLFPLESFVRVDPDSLRELLPETKEYIKRDPATAGALTQKEVGYLAEILTLYALKQGKNVLVDGSLRDSRWYRTYIQALRSQYTDIKVAIFHVTASEKTILARCRKREVITGRHVPESLVRETMQQLPRSIHVLAPYVDVVVTIENEDAGHGSNSNGNGGGGSDGPRLVESEVIGYYKGKTAERCTSAGEGEGRGSIGSNSGTNGGRAGSDDVSSAASSSSSPFVIPTRGRSNTASSTGSSRSRGWAMTQGLGYGGNAGNNAASHSSTQPPSVVALPPSPLVPPSKSLPISLHSTPEDGQPTIAAAPGEKVAEPVEKSGASDGEAGAGASASAGGSTLSALSSTVALTTEDAGDGGGVLVSEYGDADDLEASASDLGEGGGDGTEVTDGTDGGNSPPPPPDVGDGGAVDASPERGSSSGGIAAEDTDDEIPQSLLRAPLSYEEFMLMFRMTCRPPSSRSGAGGRGGAAAVARSVSVNMGRGLSSRHRSQSENFVLGGGGGNTGGKKTGGAASGAPQSAAAAPGAGKPAGLSGAGAGSSAPVSGAGGDRSAGLAKMPSIQEHMQSMDSAAAASASASARGGNA